MKTKLILLFILFSFAGLMAQEKGKFQELKKMPEPVKLAKPVYPAEAAKIGLTGLVVLEVTVDTNGKVVGVKVATENHQAADGATIDDATKMKLKNVFEKPAIDAAMKMTFSPGIDKNGKAVKSTVMIPFKFSLGDKKK